MDTDNEEKTAEECSSMIETYYLFNNPANAAHLEQSFAEAERGEFIEIDL